MTNIPRKFSLSICIVILQQKVQINIRYLFQECPPALKSDSAQNLSHNVRDAWNAAVIRAFAAMSKFPDNIIHYAVQYGESVTKKEEKAISEQSK